MRNSSQLSKFSIYRNDGFGRDTYISINNGGFNEYGYSRSYKKDYFPLPNNRNFPDLYKRRPIDKYVPDGGGRDYFIFKDIQGEHNKMTDLVGFQSTLRKSSNLKEPFNFKLNKNPSSKFERRLINRIFYGKCPGMKDRQLSPKVKFKKDIEKEKEKEKEENKINENDSLKQEFDKDDDLKKMNTLSPCRTSRRILKVNEENNNLSLSPQKEGSFLSPISHIRRKKSNRYNKITQNDNLINSVKKIFLYNSKNRMLTEDN